MASSVPQEYTQGSVDEPALQPIDGAVRTGLEKALKRRPTETELVERNIIKDSKIAPALQAAQTDLKRAQLEDKLDHAVSHRPTADELVEKGILTKGEAPDTSIPAEEVEPPSIA